MSDRCFKLKIVTPNDSIPQILCDSLKINIADGKRDKEGGSYGIRKGHAKAMFALDLGITEALVGGKTVMLAKTSRGFAKVEPDLVTLVVDSVKQI